MSGRSGKWIVKPIEHEHRDAKPWQRVCREGAEDFTWAGTFPLEMKHEATALAARLNAKERMEALRAEHRIREKGGAR